MRVSSGTREILRADSQRNRVGRVSKVLYSFLIFDKIFSAALERAAEDYIRIATSKNFLPAAVERIIGATNMDPATFSALVQSTVAHVRRVEEISGSCMFDYLLKDLV